MLIATFISTAFNYVLVYIFVYQYRNLASILICIPFITSNIKKYGLSQWLSSKEYACNAVDTGDVGSIPGSGRYPRRRAWQSTPVLLPGKSHGQRSLEGYSPWGLSELDTTEATKLGEGNGNPLQYSCLENPHGRRGLVGCSPWGR